MPTNRLSQTLAAAALGLGLMAAAPLAAQDQAAGDLPVGEPVEPRLGQTYVAETFTDWELRCVKQEEGVLEPCQLYQLLQDDQGNRVAEFTVLALPPGNALPGGATVITPLGTLLTENLLFGVDDDDKLRYPFNFCDQKGCYARMGLTEELVAAMKAGGEGHVTIYSIALPGPAVDLVVSLKGFTAGFDWLAERMAAVAAAEGN